ncbi:MAG: glycoside hydrolase family 172 protein [Bryobacteraceae bacterium]
MSIREAACAAAMAALALLAWPPRAGLSQEWPNFGLGNLPLLTRSETRSVSPENPTGEKGRGGMATPNPADPDLPFSGAAVDLGRGWKVRPFIKPKADETVTIMNVDGPGIIQHIWMASEANWAGNGRASVLRFYWDGETTPSIEVPLTDFFAVGHELFAPVQSLAVVVNPTAALNCYWPMPFRKHAKITITNDSTKDLGLFTYQITYAKTAVPENAGYFHAQWRRAMTTREHPQYTILDGVKGEGRYVGTFLAWTQLSDGWFGEGEIKFFIDGDGEFPTINGTGTEDYFCGSYGFPEVYSTAYVGNTLKHAGKEGPPKWSLYRWHIMDPISFQKDLRITIQALGWWVNGRYQPLSDDIASVAYWYQREPHAEFPNLPSLAQRWPR